MTRKPIQIAPAIIGGEGGDVLLYALCDDGSIWCRWATGEFALDDDEWDRLRDIPQDGP